jgi:hypothetical protein
MNPSAGKGTYQGGTRPEPFGHLEAEGADGGGYNDAILRNELGPKYKEYKPKVEEIKNKLKHANKLMMASKNLPLTFLK